MAPWATRGGKVQVSGRLPFHSPLNLKGEKLTPADKKILQKIRVME
jgi:hypothetical protein